MKLRCIAIIFFACLACWEVVVGQCGGPPTPGNASPSCPKDLVQVHGWVPNGTGDLFTQIWEGNNAHPNSTNPILNSQAIFDTTDVNGLPKHPNAPSTYRLWQMVGINYTAGSSTLSSEVQYNWPICQSPGCSGNGNVALGAEQAQQDGWLILPDTITCVFFRFSQQTDKSVALYIGADSINLMAMTSVLAVNGANGSSGGTVQWLIPSSAPRSNGGLGFRYVRIRIYHQNPFDYANSEVMWNVGDGFATIPRAYFQRVSHPDSADLRPIGMRPAASRFCYRDVNGELFLRDFDHQTGSQIALDQRFKENVFLVDTTMRSFDSCDSVANCGVFKVVRVVRVRPASSGKVYRRHWLQSAHPSTDSLQQRYKEAFSNNLPLPSHVNGSDTSLISSAGSTLGFMVGNTQDFQMTLDAWLLVPPKLKYLEFKLGSTSTSQSTGLWLGSNLNDMVEVASEVDGIQGGGTYALPPTASVTTFGWRWLRARLYIHDDGGSHDSRVKWDLGQGFEVIDSIYIQQCSTANDNTPPGPAVFATTQHTSREYGLRLTDGTVWKENGINQLNAQLSIRDSLNRFVQVDTLPNCVGVANPTTGADCDSTFAADPCNLDPVAVDDYVTVVKGVAKVIHPLSNDYDPNVSNTLRIIGIPVAPGQAPLPNLTDSTITYEALAPTDTVDQFEYMIRDDGAGFHTATATIFIKIEGDEDGDHVADSQDDDNDNDGIRDTEENGIFVGNRDTDHDSIPDRLDLDSDNDGIPDIVELGIEDPDTNGNVPLNPQKLLVADADTNGLDDNAANIIPPDTDGDGIKDFQDLDADNDGIPDIAERGFLSRALQGNFTSILLDVDTNGWDDRAKLLDRNDRDADDILDWLDLDSDNDGIPNILEAGYSDNDGNGRLDAMDDSILDGMNDTLLYVLSADQDGDGIPNYLDHDSDNDGIPDIIEAWGLHAGMVDSLGFFPIPLSNVPAGWQQSGRGSILFDLDEDGHPNFLDLDSDNDGLYDRVEETGNWAGTIDFVSNPQDTTGWGWDMAWRGINGTDKDGDGFPNRLDLDSDNDGICDLVEAGGIDTVLVDGMMDGIEDSNRNGADDLRMRTATLNHDGDALPDWLDLDSDNDGLLDFYEAGGAIKMPNGTVQLLVTTDTLGWSSQYRKPGTNNSDLDPLPNRIDLDSDNDGIFDYAEAIEENLLDSIDLDFNGKLDRLLGVTTFDTLFAGSLPIDTDRDLVPDHADLDSDNDGLADLFEDKPNAVSNLGSFSGTNADSTGVFQGLMRSFRDDYDNDGIPDFRDLDSDQDGISDIVESGGTDLSGSAGTGDGRFDNPPNSHGSQDSLIAVVTDIDGDGFQAHLDLDSDNDGIPDIVEAASIYPKPFPTILLGSDTLLQGWDDFDRVPRTLDWDGDGDYDFMDWDSDQDGISDAIESKKNNFSADSIADGMLDNFINIVQGWDSHNGTLSPVNTDDDLWPDYRDLESDGDSISDYAEFLYQPEDIDHDCDNNQNPNWQDELPCDLIFYQGFSPNGDGINEMFIVDGIRYHRYDNTFTVFNRWGQVVFKADPWDGQWNGICNKGGTANQPAEVGVYFYTFQFGEYRERFQKGYIYLRR